MPTRGNFCFPRTTSTQLSNRHHFTLLFKTVRIHFYFNWSVRAYSQQPRSHSQKKKKTWNPQIVIQQTHQKWRPNRWKENDGVIPPIKRNNSAQNEFNEWVAPTFQLNLIQRCFNSLADAPPCSTVAKLIQLVSTICCFFLVHVLVFFATKVRTNCVCVSLPLSIDSEWRESVTNCKFPPSPS